MPENRSKRARRAATGDRARRTRAAARERALSARVSVTQGQLLRSAQLPQSTLEASAARSRDHPTAARLDLRHTFATFALRAGISTFDLSRYMGASLTMIDRHYGHLARDGREHAIKLLDELSASEFDAWTLVDAGWTSKDPVGVSAENESDD